MPPHCEPSKWDRKIGKRLKAQRVELGLERPKVAAKAGLTATTLYKYEVGLVRIPLSNFVDICKALGVASSEMLMGL